MPKIKPLSAKLKKKAIKYGLTKKLDKQLALLQKNPQHPSLNLELPDSALSLESFFLPPNS